MSDKLTVVTVTYSPGPHLHRFLATLAHATDRPVSVVMADNGSTDGSPEAALADHSNTRLLRTGGNLGYGGAINRAVAELGPETDFFVVANPDVAWEPASIDQLLEAAGRWPRAGTLGPLIRDPDGSVYPSARHLPSLIRGGLHAVIGPIWRNNPWTRTYRQERMKPTERPVGWLSGSCLLVRKAAFDEVSPPAVMAELAAALPHATLKVVSAWAHMSPFAGPAAFAARLNAVASDVDSYPLRRE